jgi:DNA-binding transcriptional ArsR family regulator
MKENPYHDFFSNLANPLKMNIVLELNKEEKNVSELSKQLKAEQSKISHALSSLKQCKIVDMKQKGKERVYSLNKDTIVPILKIIRHHSIKNCKGCELCQ